MIDKHAPLRTVRRRHQPEVPWFDAECHEANKEVRHRESIYYRRKLPACCQLWCDAVVRFNQLLRRKQDSFWNGHIREADSDPRRLWKTLNNLLTPRTTSPDHFTAQQFSDVFQRKVEDIRAATAGNVPPTTASSQPCQFRAVQLLIRHVQRCYSTAWDYI